MSQSKDKAFVYLFRNLLATFMGAVASMMLSMYAYYQCSFAEALQRVFVYDLYTTLYFFIIWLFDYLMFELSKIVYDIYEKKVTFIPCVILVCISILVYFVPMLDLFQYNFCFLCLLISLRMLKQMWKCSPELFAFMKKDQKNGLE